MLLASTGLDWIGLMCDRLAGPLHGLILVHGNRADLVVLFVSGSQKLTKGYDRKILACLVTI